MSQLERFKVCPSCGKENLPNSADCAACGADILVEHVERRASPTPSVLAESTISANLSAAKIAEPLGQHIRLESLVQPGKSFVVLSGQTVGRSDQSDVVIEGIPEIDSVSRRMVLFGMHGQSWFVQHIAQTNYIVVDGEEYDSDDEVTIRDGTVLGLALCQFFVRTPEVAK